MAAGLLGLVVACALLTDRQSAGADTVTWKIEGSDLIVSERWSLFDVKFTRYGPGSTSELMVWRRTYHSGDAHGTYCNTTSVDSLFAYPDNGTVWTRFEFDVPPHGDPVPSDIKIDFEHNECGAKRVTVSLEYNQCEYVVYNNLPLNISKKQHEIYVKRNDVLKSIYQTSSDAKACKLRAEDKLSDERHQVTELSSTIKRLEEEASKQKHALQVMTDERDSLPAIVTSQAGLVASLTDQVTLLDGESAVLRNTSDRQASEIANLTVRGQVLDKLAAKVARLTWQRNSLTAGLIVSTGAVPVMGLLTARRSRPVPANHQNKRQAASKPLLVASLATAAAGIGLAARYASTSEPAPINDQRLLNSKPLPPLYVAPEYRLPIMAGAVTAALAVLLMTVAVVYDCSSRRRATDHDVFNA